MNWIFGNFLCGLANLFVVFTSIGTWPILSAFLAGANLMLAVCLILVKYAR